MEAKLFVTDYASYNNGKQFELGKWWDLRYYSDAEEFLNALHEYFKENGINDPELMFTDYEGFFSSLYGESMNKAEIQKIYDTDLLYEFLETSNTADKVQMHNAICEALNDMDSTIYVFDEEFFDMLGDDKMSICQKTAFGSIDWSDNFIGFDGYANFKSYSDYEIDNLINETELLEAFFADQRVFEHLV